MVSPTSIPRRVSWLALLCACAGVLAWVVLQTDVPQSSRADRPLNSSPEVTDPADSHSHVWEMIDEPMILASIGGAAMRRLRLSCPPAHLTAWVWFPLPLVHPPSVLNSI